MAGMNRNKTMKKTPWLNGKLNGTGEPAPTWRPGRSKIWPLTTAPMGSATKLQLLQNLRKTGQIK